MSDLDFIEKSVQSLVQSHRLADTGHVGADSLIKAMSKRKVKPPSVSGSIVDLEATLSRLEKGLSTEEDLKACKKIIERYRKNNALRSLPAPVEGADLPEIPEDRKAYYRYALQFPSYMKMYDDLKNDDYTEKDRKNDLLAGFSYLYNAKNFQVKEFETALSFYKRCQEMIDDTLVELQDLCREKEITIETYFNEYGF